MNSWKFQFQKSVAMVLAHLITSSAPVYDDRPSWQKDSVASSVVGGGMGGSYRHNKKRSSFAENKTVRRFGDLFNGNRAFTTEDVNGGDHLLNRPTFLDIHSAGRSSSNTSSSSSQQQQIPKPSSVSSSSAVPVSSSFSTSAMLAMSPAIPILSAARSLGGGGGGSGAASLGPGGSLLLGDDGASQYGEKLAASYKDPDLDRNNVIMLHTRSMSPNHSSASSVASPRVSEDHYSEVDHDDM